MVTPFWADVDTRGIGEVFFKETTNTTMVQWAKNIISHATSQLAGISWFRIRSVLIVTWYQVGYYNNHTDLVILNIIMYIVEQQRWLHNLLFSKMI